MDFEKKHEKKALLLHVSQLPTQTKSLPVRSTCGKHGFRAPFIAFRFGTRYCSEVLSIVFHTFVGVAFRRVRASFMVATRQCGGHKAPHEVLVASEDPPSSSMDTRLLSLPFWHPPNKSPSVVLSSSSSSSSSS